MLLFKEGVRKEDLDQELVIKLVQASVISDMDYTITSGFRPGVDGVDYGIVNGPHMTKKAADIRCSDSITRYKILYGLFKAGFKRIGLNSVHIHADVCDNDKPQNVFWIEKEPA